MTTLMTLGFTGTRQTTAETLEAVLPYRDALFRLYDCFVTGGCRGFDALIGRELLTWFPQAHHVVIVPDNRTQVDPWWEGWPQVEVIEMPEGTDYRDRNMAIVVRSAGLFFCASYPEGDPRSRRAGTWMTVRIARRAGLFTTGVVLRSHP